MMCALLAEATAASRISRHIVCCCVYLNTFCEKCGASLPHEHLHLSPFVVPWKECREGRQREVALGAVAAIAC
jgi:hypothetical protein